MADIELQYEYKPKWWAILLLGGFFTLGVVICIDQIANPWPENVPVLLWITIVLCLFGVALNGVAAVDRLRFRGRVAFTPTSLLLAKPGWSSEETIDYQAITELKVSKSGYLEVSYQDGRRTIAETLLPSRAAFEEVCERLTARISPAGQVGHAEPPAAPDRGGS